MELLPAILMGFLGGWLANYLSDVLPSRRKLTQPFCPHCEHPQTWQGYFTLRPCPHCHKSPRPRVFLTLALGILLSVWLWLNPPAKMGYWLGWLILVYFGVVAIIDLEHRLILHVVSLFGYALGLGSGIYLHGLSSALLGGGVGFGVMLLFYLAGILFARYRAQKRGEDDDEEALGFGDVMLSGVLGLLLGFPRIIVGLIFGIMAGGIFSLLIILFLVVTKKYQSMTVFIAYGPYLLLGAFILLYTPKVLTILSGY
jgi:leader peptidase (prepilin peptidase)/N-methyltransferase